MRHFEKISATVGALALGLTLAACGDDGSDSSATSGDAAAPTSSTASTATTAAGGDGSASAAAATVSAAELCPSGTLTMGVEPFEDAAKLTKAYQALADGLGQELGCKVDVQISNSYVAEILAMQNGKLDLGQFGPLGFVFANQQAGATALASFADSTGQPSSYTAGIWVPADSPIKTLTDLAGHSLALSEAGSTSGDAVPRKALIDAGVDKQVDAQYAGGHTESLEALLNGKVDAAEINSQTQASATTEGTFDASDYTEIWTSDPILNDPITAGPNMTPAMADTVQAALLALPSDTVTKIGTYLDFTPPAQGAMVEVTDDDYQPLFDLAKTLGLTTDDL